MFVCVYKRSLKVGEKIQMNGWMDVSVMLPDTMHTQREGGKWGLK